jgi:hypothetical protein
MSWRDSAFPCPKKFKKNMSSSKELASVLRGKDEISFVDYLENGATILARYYATLLDKPMCQFSLQTLRQAF